MTPLKLFRSALGASLILLLPLQPLVAQAPSERQLEVMAGSCANCHGTSGQLAGAIPSIAGRPVSILEAQLIAFHRGEQPQTTVMDRIARGFTEEELQALAAYFASQPPYRGGQ